uniref:DUF7515 domain-containing protein n=1 Tax=Acrobeloides nanus TaxID=290746 RepID=A0A914D5N9_9BILA
MDSRTTRYTSTASAYQRSNSASRKLTHDYWQVEAHDYEASCPPRSSTKETISGSESFSRMKQELLCTLSLKARYTLPMLMKAYRNETGKSAKETAELFQFSSFEEMLRSKELADIVEIDEIETSNGSIETLYLAKSLKDIKHVQKQTLESAKIPDKEYDDQLKAISIVGEENFLECKHILSNIVSL